MNEKTILRGGHFQRNPQLMHISDEQKTSVFKIGLITIFVLLVLSLAIAPASAWSGSGTESDPYLISSAEELALLAENVNAGSTYAGEYFLVTQDIDLSGYASWTPIGAYTSSDNKPFRGIFDGGSRNISNLIIEGDYLDAGLFGYVSDGTVIMNVHLENSVVSSDAANVGGLVGYVLTSASGSFVTIENCYSSGEVSSSSLSYVGGLVGYVRTYDSSSVITIENCYSSGEVSSSPLSYAGGLVGCIRVQDSVSVITIENCYSSSDISGYLYVGGLVGHVYSSSGSVTGNSKVSIANCYSSGSVSGNSEVGGLIGDVSAYDSDSVITIENSVALNPAVTGSFNVSRIVGHINDAGSVTLTDNYALSTMDAGGATDGLDVSPAEAQTQSFYENTLGWDFTNVWIMDASKSPCPILQLRSSGVVIKPMPEPTASPIGFVGLISGLGIALAVLRRK